MDATAVNPMQRIRSAGALKQKLMQLLYCDRSGPRHETRQKAPSWIPKVAVPVAIIAILIFGFMAIQRVQQPLPLPASVAKSPQQLPSRPSPIGSVSVLPHADHTHSPSRTRDKSVLRFIPPAELELADGNPFGKKRVAVAPFYMAESPVTNQQYIGFLNANMDRVKVVESDVFLEDHLVLKLSEKIRNYKPITFDGQKFVVKEPMHSACAVLLVTGYGAEAYARYYNLRLPRAQEWIYVMIAGGRTNSEPLQLPLPVINYEPDIHGLRGINQVAEWGKMDAVDFIILGQASSSMIEGGLMLEKDPLKYYTDTTFRVAKDVKKQ